MRKMAIMAFMLLSAATTLLSAAENEINVSPTTPSVALFKNGVTVIQQEINIPEPGVYLWDKVPLVIHGTFFIESDLNVEIRTTQRLVTLPIDENNQLKTINDLIGKQITVRFHNEDLGISVVRGKLIGNASPKTNNSLFPDFSGTASRRGYPYSDYPYSEPPYSASANFGTPLKLETTDRRYIFLTGQQISHIETKEPVTERSERRPVMIFQVTPKDGKNAGKIRLFYLTKGTTWAPSYRVDLLDNKRLRIEQSALIRNELIPLNNTEISLVSGFPQVASSNVLSPLSPEQTLQQFFQQVISQHRGYENNDIAYISNAFSNSITPRSSVANSGFDTSTLAAGEGPDIYYNKIGKKTLEVGDTLSLSTGKGESDYRRVLESDLVTSIQKYYKNQHDHGTDRFITPDVFDVLKFPNPLPFPMTTALATVTEKQKFLGQSQSNWVNPGQVASVKITKVMNVPVTYFEQGEDHEPRKITSRSDSDTFYYSGRHYISRTVTGTIEVINQRNEEIILH
ncbi:MAG: hypothetical protein LBK82_02020 [Planctomycetaceae bacterium]|jgi:hypothetical protein|nr:hypothetical protein [Planctomycetaceae bacterium]